MLVKSSNIKSVEFNNESQALVIEFHSGGIYEYTPVPETVFRKMVSAESVGKFFHKHIKNEYACRKVGDESSKSEKGK